MFATLFCYRCRTFQPEASMRRVSTKSGARWRCLKCLEESGWKPPDNPLQDLLQENEEARRALLAAAILRDAHPQREKKFLGRALLLSLLLHAALISLQLGDQDFGLPWSRASVPLETAQGAVIRAVLRTASAETAQPLVAPFTGQLAVQTSAAQETAMPYPSVEMRASGDTIRGHEEKSLSAQKNPGSTARPPKEKPTARALQKKAEILATNASSAWKIPFERTASQAAEESASDSDQGDQPSAVDRSEPIKTAHAREKSDEQPPVVKIDDADQAELAAATARQEAAQSKQNEAALRRAAEARQAEAAIAQANQAAAERQQNEDRRRIEAEQATAKARLAAREQQYTEEQLRIKTEQASKIRAAIEAEKIKAETAALTQSRQEAVERDRQEALARSEAKQAAAAKVSQEARDKQRAAELEQGRQAASIAKNIAEKPGERAPPAAAKVLEKAMSTPPAPPSLAPDGPKRKALILGTDPKNISLAFYGEGWRQKIERIGAANYPKLYKDRYYGPLVATVTINSDGTLAGVHIDQSSGEQEVDEAVRRIVEMSAPFAAFPPDLKRGYDQIDITRTWVFEHPSKVKQ